MSGNSWPRTTDSVLNAIDTNGLGWFIINNKDFWGSGSDGTLGVAASSTTTLFGVKHYTSVTIASGGAITKSSNNNPLIIFCDGTFTLNGTIGLFGLGCKGGNGGSLTSQLGEQGHDSPFFGGDGGDSSGAGGTSCTLIGVNSPFRFAPCGSGGGGGTHNGSNAGGTGGKGGGGFMLFAKTLVFGASSIIDVRGANATSVAGQDGGGGAGGYGWICYGALTSAGMTYKSAGGTGTASGEKGKVVVENMTARTILEYTG